jgi:hypothetical protein
MIFTVQVGPPQISIHHGQTVLVSKLDEGCSAALADEGFSDTGRTQKGIARLVGQVSDMLD